jgi:predicted metal-dependent enzyme (double-stranded beta helix superfamily)
MKGNVVANSALDTFTTAVRAAWGELSSDLVQVTRTQLDRLLAAEPAEPWLASLRADQPESRELYRDPAHGFVLQAHVERAGTIRTPHDHGLSWVIYGVQDGEVEMTTFARIISPSGGVRLVKRDAARVRAGEVQVYLPGDIHQTECLSPTATLLRFSERDLRAEDKQFGRLTRYVRRGGVWTVGEP